MRVATRPIIRSKSDLEAAMDEVGAWAIYLRETRGLEAFRYEEVEPWAWARLQERLKRMRGQRREAA